jgi:hypothetical protein
LSARGGTQRQACAVGHVANAASQEPPARSQGQFDIEQPLLRRRRLWVEAVWKLGTPRSQRMAPAGSDDVFAALAAGERTVTFEAP